MLQTTTTTTTTLGLWSPRSRLSYLLRLLPSSVVMRRYTAIALLCLIPFAMKIIRSWRHRPRPVKKALLIGIVYRELDETYHLPCTANDVEKLRLTLIERFGYRPEDIVVMTDHESGPQNLKPTRKNILHQIRALVAGAQDGDHFLFHFAGHSSQVECKDKSEDDNMDEILICADEGEIRDNKLRKMLVNPLPKGASLTAIFDSCYSGTLLDLEHYVCNNVYVPWVNKGSRRSSTLRNRLERKNALSRAAEIGFEAVKAGDLKEPVPALELRIPLRSTRISNQSSQQRLKRMSTQSRRFSSRDTLVDVNLQIFQTPQPLGDILDASEMNLQSPKPSHSLFVNTWLPSNVEGTLRPQRPSVHADDRQWTQSPDGLYNTCEGFCRQKTLEHKFVIGGRTIWADGHPNVISISSSRDGQMSWDDVGSSMTLSLIDILAKNPKPSLHNLMTQLNHRLHNSTREMHRYARAAKQSQDASQSDFEIEMDNFQEPQLGSLSPLNMQDTFVL